MNINEQPFSRRASRSEIFTCARVVRFFWLRHWTPVLEDIIFTKKFGHRYLGKNFPVLVKHRIEKIHTPFVC